MADKKADGDAPKKGGKLVIIIVALVVVLGAGGGAAWFFLRPADANATAVEKPKPSVFLPLETFTVNLQPDDGQPQFVQTALTLELEDQATADLVKERMPLVRDRILMVLSSKKSADLLPVAGKRKLATEIAATVEGAIQTKPKAKRAPPPEEAEAAEDGEDEEAKAARKARAAAAAAAAAAAKGASVKVLFTAFMIQ